MNQVTNQHHKTFENIRRYSKEGREFWSARDLLPILEYSSWDKFKAVIRKAIKACDNSDISSADHFSQVGKMVTIRSKTERHIPDDDYHLSRYACYLIVQNGDSTKPAIANVQKYFAMQTRRQELADDLAFQQLDENKKRVRFRGALKEHNRQLARTAKQAGVETGLDFGIFQNHGYKGLYGGLDAKGIHQKKNLKKSQPILDHMGRVVRNWRLTCSALRRQKTNCAATAQKVKRKPTKSISTLVLKYVKRLKSWAVPCPRIFQRRKQAPRLSRNNTKNRLAREMKMSSLKLPEGWTRTTLEAFMDFKNGIHTAKEA